MDKQLLIYTDQVTNRLKYVLDIILTGLNGIYYRLITDFDEYNKADHYGINYSERVSEKGIHIYPSGLLAEEGIRVWEVGYVQDGQQHTLFYDGRAEEIPFDLFAASFYMLSRYEEYLPFEADVHGRFGARQSIAWKYGFLEEPVVHQWAGLLVRTLQNRYPDLKVTNASFKVEVSVDVDMAYAFLYRPLGRMFMASCKDFATLRWIRMLRRFSVMAGLSRDPFDTYNFFKELHSRYQVPVYMFYLMAGSGPFDRNLTMLIPQIKDLLKALDQDFTLGIHPSYVAANDYESLEQETGQLSALIQRKIEHSRQHFLRLNLPKTYQWLISQEIGHDHSMGYHDHPGFRAGITTPFLFYDLSRETITHLTIHPFIFMDRTLKDRLSMEPEMAMYKVQELLRKVEKVNGCFVSLWHNESLSNFGEWKGWRFVFEVMVSMSFAAMKRRRKEFSASSNEPQARN